MCLLLLIRFTLGRAVVVTGVYDPKKFGAKGKWKPIYKTVYIPKRATIVYDNSFFLLIHEFDI